MKLSVEDKNNAAKQNENVGIVKHIGIQQVQILFYVVPQVPMKLTSPNPDGFKGDLTIAQAKVKITKGDSVNLSLITGQLVGNIKFKITPNSTGIFDLTKTILNTIKSAYVRKKIFDCLSPAKRDEFRYALRVFSTDCATIGEVNTTLISCISEYARKPNKYAFMNIAHCLFTGLDNDTIIDIIANSNLELPFTVYYHGEEYTRLEDLVEATEFKARMLDPDKDLRDLSQIKGNEDYTKQEFSLEFPNRWQQLLAGIAYRYRILLLNVQSMYMREEIVTEGEGGAVIDYDITQPFIDVRILLQLPQFYYRVL